MKRQCVILYQRRLACCSADSCAASPEAFLPLPRPPFLPAHSTRKEQGCRRFCCCPRQSATACWPFRRTTAALTTRFERSRAAAPGVVRCLLASSSLRASGGRGCAASLIGALRARRSIYKFAPPSNGGGGGGVAKGPPVLFPQSERRGCRGVTLDVDEQAPYARRAARVCKISFLPSAAAPRPSCSTVPQRTTKRHPLPSL